MIPKVEWGLRGPAMLLVSYPMLCILQHALPYRRYGEWEGRSWCLFFNETCDYIQDDPE